MLKDFKGFESIDKEDLRYGIREEREHFAASQMKLPEAKLPVMVIFEGWNAAGKGELIGKVIRNIDPTKMPIAATVVIHRCVTHTRRM